MQSYFQTDVYGEMHNIVIMTEEIVTISIIKKLKIDGWRIISFDYPQSGTGKMIKPDINEKNLGGFIPDIVSLKDGIVLFWENKDRFVYDDFIKIRDIKASESFDKPIKDFLSNIIYTNIYFGIGIPKIEKEINKAAEFYNYIDFFVTVDNQNIEVLYRANEDLLTTISIP